MSDILFDDVPVEQQETVVGCESFSYYSFSRTNGKELTKEEREEWLKKIWAVNESSSFKRLLRSIFN
ncbi:hypothetical protein PN471_14710 [Aphanizomenon sp. CS-733/32]|uniref:hypothetical protein n=1 Tax=Aphanizomenon sp. CS-733/32 TaxID=3021715 RepID=UPI00232CFDC1|nr:hypothetical protein [Aphanizomenon sp. CS-733/32]MDB9309861.1 hypothetical protein [Aphanizomenon sp. CS-733/32]